MCEHFVLDIIIMICMLIYNDFIAPIIGQEDSVTLLSLSLLSSDSLRLKTNSLLTSCSMRILHVLVIEVHNRPVLKISPELCLSKRKGPHPQMMSAR